MAAKTIEKLLGTRIAEQRRHRGLTQAELAETADVAPETISRLERGAAMPSLSRLSDIAQVLGIELRDLLPAGKPTAKQGALDRLSAVTQDLSADQVDALVRVAQALYGSGGSGRGRRRGGRKGG